MVIFHKYSYHCIGLCCEQTDRKYIHIYTLYLKKSSHPLNSL